MKNFRYIILIAAVSTLFGCTKQLDQVPVSSVTTTNFYSNATDFKQGVTGVYNQLKTYPDFALWMGEVRSDNVAPLSDGNRDWQGINDFSPNLTTTSFIVSEWNDMYNGIANANTVISALNTKGGNIGSDSLRTRYMAECRFLRAFYYFQLVKSYGKVPLIDTVMTTDQVLTVKQSEPADVYDLIISDLTFAIGNLPKSYTQADYGRPTTYAAEGLLGLVYMTRSGPTYDIDGPGLNSNEWSKASALFDDIIASKQYKLLTSFPSVFSYTNENNAEVLFDVQFSSTSSADFPTELVPIGYWSGLGLSSYGNGYGSATYNVPPDLLASYKNDGNSSVDVRDTFSIQHSWATSTTSPILDTTDPFIKKYLNVGLRGTSYNNWPVNFIVLRYADILLMKAECILHGASGSQSDVDTLVNQVRDRAGVSELTNVNMATLMEERRREFLGEGLRWNDLVREGMAVTTMNNWISENAYTTINQVVVNYVIYPIPEAEILVKPGLYNQNPGYN